MLVRRPVLGLACRGAVARCLAAAAALERHATSSCFGTAALAGRRSRRCSGRRRERQGTQQRIGLRAHIWPENRVPFLQVRAPGACSATSDCASSRISAACSAVAAPRCDCSSCASTRSTSPLISGPRQCSRSASLRTSKAPAETARAHTAWCAPRAVLLVITTSVRQTSLRMVSRCRQAPKLSPFSCSASRTLRCNAASSASSAPMRTAAATATSSVFAGSVIDGSAACVTFLAHSKRTHCAAHSTASYLPIKLTLCCSCCTRTDIA